MTERDWRESAYLKKENWPEAIPPTGPKREYGPEPWFSKVHPDPHNLDDYPSSHPDAASIGYQYGGDVCPYCGVPLENDVELVDQTGQTGTIWDLARDDVTIPVYHPECWKARRADRRRKENASLAEYTA